MTEPLAREVIITAEPERALVEVCGISIIERQLRILQRLGVARATIISASVDAIRRHVERPSWARSQIEIALVQASGPTTTTDDIRARAADQHSPLLLLDGGSHFDARLLRTLLERDRPALLIDAAPPLYLRSLLEGAVRTERGFVCGAASVTAAQLTPAHKMRRLLETLSRTTEIELIDVGQQSAYVPDMRRNIRPLWFPAPSPQNAKLAEDLVLDAAQNGTLDLPAIAHGPIETAIVRRLCRTRITPMHITLFTAAVSSAVTWLFASGQLLAGTWLALSVGVLDGLDGKQARVKVESTELGKREHVLDYVLELSWWIALAYHFASTGALPNAYALLLLLVGSDVVDRYAKRIAKQRTGRNLDDVAPIDRFVRLIGGRRNVYIWILAVALAVGAGDESFAVLCYWGAVTAAIHMLRAGWIARRTRRA
jgi:phosphatidylglycerophosphate synthase